MTKQSALSRHAVILFIISLLCYGSTAGGSLSSTDAVATYELTRNLVENGSVALTTNPSGSQRSRGVDGRYYAKQGIGHAVYSIPFYLTGRLAERLTRTRLNQSDLLPKAALAVGSTVVAAGCVALTFLFGWHVTQNWLASLFGSLALGFGTLLWPYSKFGFNAPLAALCLLAATYTAWVATRLDRPKTLALTGWLLGFGWLVRHEFLLVAAPVAVWLVLESNGNRSILIRWIRLVAPGITAAGVIWGMYNWLRFGNVFDVGHTPEYGLTGFYGFLVSPGGSVFLYSPILLAGVIGLVNLWRADRNLATLLGGQVIMLFCYYASLDDWIGGRSYGPRYLVSILPLICVVIVWWFHQCDRRGRKLLFSLAVTSVLVQLPGVLVDYSKPSFYHQGTNLLTHQDRQDSWRDSYLVSNVLTAWSAVPHNVNYVLGTENPPPVTSTGKAGEPSISQQLSFSLDLWWLYLFHLGVLSGSVAVGLGLAPLGIVLVLSRQLRQDPIVRTMS